MNIPHLHLHSAFSVLDGIPSPTKYLKYCDEIGIPAIAFTEHGNMGSHAEASIESPSYKTKVILGMEAYVSRDVGKIAKARRIVSKTKIPEKKEKASAYLKKNRSGNHVVLLARNEVGYSNLIALNNFAWTTGFYYRPRIDFEKLEEKREGLIALSACQSGIVSKHLLNGEDKKAIDVAKFMKRVFGKDFYLELQFLDMPIQDVLNKKLVELGRHLKIPFVLTNDVHYLRQKDYKIQELLIELMTFSKKKDEDPFHIETTVNFLKTLKDFEKDFRDHKSVPKKVFIEAIDNVQKIADECNYVVRTGNLYFPSFNHKTHFMYKDYPIKDKNEFFRKILLVRSKLRLEGKLRSSVYKERLAKEFKILKKLGAIDYFLIVDDLLNYVRENGAFSVIRGSANGSLIAFVFEFGLIDPIRHSIMFERFISEHRSLNDVDIDIDVRSEFRIKAVQYLRDKYGDDRVISVGTYTRMGLKGAIKDITRVMKDRLDRRISKAKTKKEIEKLRERQKEYTFATINRVTSQLEGDLTVKEARKNEIFDEWYGKNKKVMKEKIEPTIGNIKNVSMHPAGVIITPGNMDGYLPIRTNADPRNKSNRIISTVWENSHTGREDLNEIGVMALDVLGVQTLSIISEVMEMVKNIRKEKINLYDLDLEDKKTIAMFNKHELTGVFQFSAPAASKIVGQTKITEFNDLVVINALARPGALQAGADRSFAKRKADSDLVEFDHHSLKPVLGDSLGVLVFSEHILRTASEFAGMHPKKADSLRKIIKGKNQKSFNAYKKEFIRGAMEKWKSESDIEDVALKIWKKFSQAGSYLFPRGHASSYALLGYICQYLKVHYSVEFFACHLRYQQHEKYGEIRDIARSKYKLGFIMPNINLPTLHFEPERDNIRWPITALKNVGDKAAESIIMNAPFSSVKDFFKRVDRRVCNKRVVENLIIAGAMDDFGDKESVALEYIKIKADIDKKKGVDLHPAFDSDEAMRISMKDIFGFEVDPLRKVYRKELKPYISNLDSMNDFNMAGKGDQVLVFGEVSKTNAIISKKGDKMAFSSINDGDAVYEITLFPIAFKILGKKFKKGNVLVVSGVKDIYKGKTLIKFNDNMNKQDSKLSKGSWVKKLEL